MFEIITSSSYWISAALWLAILGCYIADYREGRGLGKAVAVLLTVLAIDAFRTLAESLYFGLYHTSFYGLLPIAIYDALSDPRFVLLPKIVNVGAAILILALLARRWVAHDLAERRRQERALRDHERRLEAAHRIACISHWEWDAINDETYWSDEMFRLLGYEPGEVEPSYPLFTKAVHPEDKDRLVFRRTLPSGHHSRSEFRIVQPSGEVRCVDSQFEVDRDEKGRVLRILGTLQDITGRKEAELALAAAAEARKNLESIINRSPAMAIRRQAKPPYKVEYISDNIDMFGYSAADVREGRITSSDIVHPDDRRRVTREAASHRRTRRDQYSQEYRFITAEGEIRWVEDRSRVIRASDGTPTHIESVIFDITERKNMEEALRQSQEQIRSIVETTGVIPWELDLETWRFTYVGPQAAELLGYPIEDWYRENFWPEHIHPDDRQRSVAYCKSATAQGEDHDFEYRMIRKDGTIVWLRDIVHVISEAGRPALLRGVMVNVTPQKEIEAALHRSEEQSRSILASTPVPLLIARLGDGVLVYANDHFESALGLEPGAAIGLELRPIFRNARHYREILRSLEENGQIRDREIELVRSDGRAITALASAARILHDDEPAILIGFYDITERKAVLDALKISESRLSNAQRMAGLGYSHWNADDERVWLSDEARRIFGFPESGEDIPLDELFEAIAAQDRVRVRTILAYCFTDGGVVDFEFRVTRADGETRHLHGRNEAVRDELGRIQALTGIVQDITERKRGEAALKKALEDAESSNRAKTEFLSNISHELRTPLNAIIGFSEVMQTELLGALGSPRYKEYADGIHGSGTHLLQIINDILDLSKVEAGRLELQEAAADIRAIVKSCLKLVSERARGARVILSEAFDDELPRIRVDATKIKQVVLNLLTNAIKFTPAGGYVMVSVTRDEGGGLKITIRDTGIGISENDIDKVMVPFGQVAASQTRAHDGTGLGLPLSKALVELHGGTFAVESEPGVGTTVTVRLPKDRLVRAA